MGSSQTRVAALAKEDLAPATYADGDGVIVTYEVAGGRLMRRADGGSPVQVDKLTKHKVDSHMWDLRTQHGEGGPVQHEVLQHIELLASHVVVPVEESGTVSAKEGSVTVVSVGTMEAPRTSSPPPPPRTTKPSRGRSWRPCCCLALTGLCCVLAAGAVAFAAMVLVSEGDADEGVQVAAEGSVNLTVTRFREVVVYANATNATNASGCANSTEATGAAAEGNCGNSSRAPQQVAVVVLEEVTESVTCPYELGTGEADDGCPRGPLRVEVRGVDSDEGGRLRVLVYASAKAWDSDSRYRRGFEASRVFAVVPGAVEVNFTGLLQHDYAVMVHHDEDSDGKLDTFFGFPTEGLCASRGASGGPGGGPKWKDAVFAHEELTEMSVDMWYA